MQRCCSQHNVQPASMEYISLVSSNSSAFGFIVAGNSRDWSAGVSSAGFNVSISKRKWSQKRVGWAIQSLLAGPCSLHCSNLSIIQLVVQTRLRVSRVHFTSCYQQQTETRERKITVSTRVKGSRVAIAPCDVIGIRHQQVWNVLMSDSDHLTISHVYWKFIAFMSQKRLKLSIACNEYFQIQSNRLLKASSLHWRDAALVKCKIIPPYYLDINTTERAK